MKTKVTIIRGQKYTITMGNKVVELTHKEWMELRRLQNSLIYTEPK